MKRKALLVVVLMLVFSMGNALSETIPLVSTNDNLVIISGKTDREGEGITVTVNDEHNTRHYIDQILSDENGNYIFEFTLNNGTYKGKISTSLQQYEVEITVKSGTSTKPEEPNNPGSGGTGGSGGLTQKPVENQQPQEQGKDVDIRKSFMDVKTHWAINEIEILAGKGIISGMSEDYFMPDEKITRAQFATLLFKLLELQPVEYKGMFSDVEAKDWYSTIVESVADIGIVLGSNGKFNPNKEITREEMSVMIIRALEDRGIIASSSVLQFSDKGEISSWALESVAQAVEMGIIKGMTSATFEPKIGATRAQAAVMVYRLMDQL